MYIYIYIHLISYISYIPKFWAWPRHFSERALKRHGSSGNPMRESPGMLGSSGTDPEGPGTWRSVSGEKDTKQ